MRAILYVTLASLLLIACSQNSDGGGADATQARTKKASSKNKPNKTASKKGASKKTTSKKDTSPQKTPKKARTRPKDPKPAATPNAPTPPPKGRPFDGPPSEAIVGQWDIRLNRDSLPEGIQNFKELDAMFRGTMRFDGSIVVVNISGQADAIPYKVLRDENETLEIALAEAETSTFEVTFINHDHIKLKDNRRKGELLGARQIKDAPKP